jgi:glycosyltransferase involved in cell wall biosynthesis
VRNCTGQWGKSAGYAARNAVARLRGSFERIDRFIALTAFVKLMLVQNGYPAERIDVVRNLVRLETTESQRTDGEYVGYLGRVSPEKGVDTIVEAARGCLNIPFRFAGHYLKMPNLPRQAGMNCHFLGAIPTREVGRFLASARFIILSSRWYEVSPLSLVEAALWGKSVICSRLGGLPEFVDDGATGLLFAPGDPQDLAEKVRYLWERPELCREMGEAARTKILTMFSPEVNYARLLDTYRAASSGSCGVAADLEGRGA